MWWESQWTVLRFSMKKGYGEKASGQFKGFPWKKTIYSKNKYKASFLPSALLAFNQNYNSH